MSGPAPGGKAKPRVLRFTARGTLSGMAPGQFTLLLRNWSGGSKAALDSLTPVVYQELRKLAAGKLGRERDARTLQPTALIHEAYLKLVQHNQEEWHSRAHFFSVASHIMREILVDHARR